MPQLDPVRLEIFRSLFSSVAEEMGATLMRSASSPNIKERRDYSCAIFNGNGELIAQGEHMPVHLGSMPLSVQAAIDEMEFEPGDVVLLNDPFRGGTHLPDLTMIMPVFIEVSEEPTFFMANRAHHADVGGMSPGSMPVSTEIYQEGQIIPPVKWRAAGDLNDDLQRTLLANVRTPVERKEDLAAQEASLKVGAKRTRELTKRYGLGVVQNFMTQVLDYSDTLMRKELEEIPDGTYIAEDYLDDDGSTAEPVKIRCTIRIDEDTADVDFSGSAPQVRGSLNAVSAITFSATVYCFRCMAENDIPVNEGCFRPLTVIAPKGTVVNATRPAAVAGGNVETSQRIVDVVLKALSRAVPERIPAASQGTMNNVAIGGTDNNGEPFGYYETIAGGMGARPSKDGISGIHNHMTNTMNTPIEALETSYPFRITEYRFRDFTGGTGTYRGGDGIIRSLQVLCDCSVTVLSERRIFSPYGLQGGNTGFQGLNILTRKDGNMEGMPSKFNIQLRAGDVLTIETPGGGGYGKPEHIHD
ncbi:MAG: hydantoinase B/oxoprolinase family protein [Candidatus Marinimicrobia bacterium]|nr:hydantoinase B/oxoprolinase family protein [Candidatus Neomarinimicrobiota bacterium]MCF7828689.1 hydantoinase B/oxoprolinase family protein [Candidatus Neomarinimicrobiota bacterium]MCF7880430.1 hydantoinase B/oxoprolinase family protein [Candidatus Neomarinimicrobiota bacterium]